MRADALRAVLEDVTGPFLVCAQAGNVNTGAFDPIARIADAVGERNRHPGTCGWLHVDGAFGLWATRRRLSAPTSSRASTARTGGRPTDASGSTCPTTAASCSASASRERIAATMFTAERPTFQATAAERDPHEFVPEESRRGRDHHRSYAALRSLGTSGVADMIERCCRPRRPDGRERSGAIRMCAILNDVVLNQVLVRFEVPGRDADALSPRRHRGRAARGHVLARRHDMARRGRHARGGQQLVDHRRRHRQVGGGDPGGARSFVRLVTRSRREPNHGAIGSSVCNCDRRNRGPCDSRETRSAPTSLVLAPVRRVTRRAGALEGLTDPVDE